MELMRITKERVRVGMAIQLRTVRGMASGQWC